MSSQGRVRIEPRLLSREQAANYCGLSLPTFQAECPVIPIKIRTRILYDRQEIDRWIDSKGPAQPELPTGKDWLRLLDNADADKGN